MHTFRTVCATLLGVVVFIVLASAAGIYTGAYNVAASDKHWPITYWVLQKTIQNSVAAHAATIEAPTLGGQKQLLAGVANFDAMCSGCHEPPGARPSVAAQGMYPQPPNLAHAGKEMAANEIYWILKHGIKASGMPAWGATHSDDELWAMTAFVQQLPDISAADYKQMLAAAESNGIGHDHGGAGHGDDDGHDHEGSHNDDPTGAAEERAGSHGASDSDDDSHSLD